MTSRSGERCTAAWCVPSTISLRARISRPLSNQRAGSARFLTGATASRARRSCVTAMGQKKSSGLGDVFYFPKGHTMIVDKNAPVACEFIQFSIAADFVATEESDRGRPRRSKLYPITRQGFKKMIGDPALIRAAIGDARTRAEKLATEAARSQRRALSIRNEVMK